LNSKDQTPEASHVEGKGSQKGIEEKSHQVIEGKKGSQKGQKSGQDRLIRSFIKTQPIRNN
jgi:hypothetical protein